MQSGVPVKGGGHDAGTFVKILSLYFLIAQHGKSPFGEDWNKKRVRFFKTLLFCIWIIRQRMAGKQDDVRVLQQQSAVSDDERRYRLRGVE